MPGITGVNNSIPAAGTRRAGRGGRETPVSVKELPYGNGAIVTETPQMKTKIDAASSSTTYVGHAGNGSLSSDAVWRIQRITVIGTVTTIEWAGVTKSDGVYYGTFENVWDNRTSLTYG